LPRLDAVRKSDQPVVGLELSQTLPERGNVDGASIFLAQSAGQKTQGVAIVLDDMMNKKSSKRSAVYYSAWCRPQCSIKSTRQFTDRRQKRYITSCFADIRGFTAYSEQHSPEELVAVLNRYLAQLRMQCSLMKALWISSRRRRHGWYNAPLPQPDHTFARRGKSALAIRDAVAALHTELPQEAHLDFGVGIHYGELCWDGLVQKNDLNTQPHRNGCPRRSRDVPLGATLCARPQPHRGWLMQIFTARNV